ncbi:MAG: hypothetical protein Q8R92_20360 [Deltaproteobacteria bacterium]|nr:hypothetical protein [Deltaproteobacteria bacterium]
MDKPKRRGRPPILGISEKGVHREQGLLRFLVTSEDRQSAERQEFAYTEFEIQARRIALDRLNRVLKKHGLRQGRLRLREVKPSYLGEDEIVKKLPGTIVPSDQLPGGRQPRFVRVDFGSDHNWRYFTLFVVRVLLNPDEMKDLREWERVLSNFNLETAQAQIAQLHSHFEKELTKEVVRIDLQKLVDKAPRPGSLEYTLQENRYRRPARKKERKDG